MFWFMLVLYVLTVSGLVHFLLKSRSRHRLELQARQEDLTALSRSIDGLRGVLEHIRQKPDWAESFCALATREFDSDGGAIYYHASGESSGKVIKVLCTAGVCRDWNLVVGDDTQVLSPKEAAKAKVRFEPGVPADFFWSRRPHIYNDSELDPWIPPVIDTPMRSGLISPIRTEKGDSYLLLLRSGEKPRFGNDDQNRLNQCVAVAEAGFFALQSEIERQRLEQNLQSAHEEGMLQISTGIIHNIGNGITVIQIALDRLKTGEVNGMRELADFLDREIMPDFMRHLEAGDIQHFLTQDPQGQEYLGALTTLIGQIPGVLAEHEKELEFVVDKFKNVTEIITLQQQFIGELGTENIVAVNTIVNDVLKICQQPLEQNHLELKSSLKANDRILVDTAMMRHMLLLLMKLAIEAAASSRRTKGVVKVETFQGQVPNREETYVSISISDNGSGREIVLKDEEILADRQSVDEVTRDLYFIKRRVEKYGGIFDLQAEFGVGTHIVIHIPSYDAGSRGKQAIDRAAVEEDGPEQECAQP